MTIPLVRLFSVARIVRVSLGIVFVLVCLFVGRGLAFDSSPSPSTPVNLADPVGIAVIQDGPSLVYDRFVSQVREELTVLLGETHRVRWIRLPRFDARWNPHAVSAILQSALDHPQVHIVLSLGVLTTESAARQNMPLSKAVVGACTHLYAMANLPVSSDGRSTKSNFTFAVNPHRVRDDIRAFRQLRHFDQLHVLVDEPLLRGLPGLEAAFREAASPVGPNIRLVPVGSQADMALDALPESTQAVYLTFLPTMSPDEQRLLVEALNDRGIPTFSQQGLPLVEMGVLAGLAPDDEVRLARRMALQVQQLILGRAAVELPVLLQESDALVINGSTARRIGFSPTFAQKLEARWVSPHEPQERPTLSLEQSMLMAAERNVALDIERSRKDAAAQEHLKTRSLMLPQLTGQALYQRIDRDRSLASLGLMPEERTTLGVALRQMIFDDAVVSAWRATGRLARAREFELESRRLDILAEAGERYLQLLSAHSLLRIEKQALELTQTHLNMARTRREIGLSGPEDVHRWESEAARRKSALLAAQTRVEQVRLALNQTLGVSQDTGWSLRDISLDQGDFYFLDGSLAPLVRTVDHWERLRDFFVDVALELAPELRALDELAQARGIERDRLRRRFITPSVHALFHYDRELDSRRPGGGIGGLPIPITLPEADKNDWSVGVAVTLPLFEGGGRVHDLRRSEAELRGLLHTREQAGQLITQRVGTALFALQSSHPNIHLTREAARLAHETLQVVRNKYARGTAGILDLLDAQNQVVMQDQAAALAVYDYLRDLVQWQRALSWFDADKTGEEKARFLTAVEEHLSMGGADDRFGASPLP